MINKKITNVILAAGSPLIGSNPTSIEKVNLKYNVAQWAIKTLGDIKNTHIVIGYDFDKGCLGFAINLTKTTEVIGY